MKEMYFPLAAFHPAISSRRQSCVFLMNHFNAGVFPGIFIANFSGMVGGTVIH